LYGIGRADRKSISGRSAASQCAAHKKRSWQIDPSICHDLYPETGQTLGSPRPPDIVVVMLSAVLGDGLKPFFPSLAGMPPAMMEPGNFRGI
jgi:hypothetical protein